MTLKKILWTIKRHPFLYTTRFKLLSKNSSIIDIEGESYNQINFKKDIPSYFYEINELIFKNNKPKNDLDIIMHMSSWLRERMKGGPGLSVPSESALKIMLAGKGGVCSDIVQIFNNFCVINDIQVREWGVTRAPFCQDYGGHSFNEFYCKEYSKWVLIDSFWCVLFYSSNGVPLSTIELFESVRKNVTVKHNAFYNVPNFNDQGIEKNFYNINNIPFLICNYSNKIYDTYLKYLRPFIPVFIIHFVLFLLNRSYYYKFPLDDYKKIFS